MGERTRWTPVLMECYQQGAPGNTSALYVAKLRRQEPLAESTAACVSEVVCGALLCASSVRCAEPALVQVSEDLAGGLTEIAGYEVVPGLHFGSLYVHVAATTVPQGVDLVNPEDLVAIWYFDNWVCNMDRAVEGNVLYAAEGGWRVVAIDHSDCFGGSSVLSREPLDRNVQQRSRPVSMPRDFANLVAPIAYQGLRQIGRSKLHATRACIDDIVAQVPREWWSEIRNGPDDIVQFLEQRWQRVDAILEDFDDLGDLLQDGVMLDV